MYVRNARYYLFQVLYSADDTHINRRTMNRSFSKAIQILSSLSGSQLDFWILLRDSPEFYLSLPSRHLNSFSISIRLLSLSFSLQQRLPMPHLTLFHQRQKSITSTICLGLVLAGMSDFESSLDEILYKLVLTKRQFKKYDHIYTNMILKLMSLDNVAIILKVFETVYYDL